MFSALIIICVLALHRPKGSTPIVNLINTFLLFSSLFAAVQLRTFYYVPSARHSAFLPAFAADFGVRWLLFLTTSTKAYDPRKTAEERASFISRLFFLYLLPSLFKGAKTPIELQDFEPLATSYASRNLEAKLYSAWHSSAEGGDSPATMTADHDDSFPEDAKLPQNLEELPMSDLASADTVLHKHSSPRSYLPKNPTIKPNLVHASLSAFAGDLFSSLPTKAVYTVLVLLQPLLVQETLSFIESYTGSASEPKPAAYGWGIVGAFFLIYLLLALSNGHFQLSIYKTTIKLRGALVSAVYHKTLVLSLDALQDPTNPSPTVMQSVDIERIVHGLDPFHEIWSGVVIIIVGLYLMWQQVGVSFVATILTLAGLLASIPLITKDVSRVQNAWSTLTDERTTLTAAAINGIKAVKQSALEDFLIFKIVAVRAREIKALGDLMKALCLVSFMGNTGGDVILLATITTFAIFSAFQRHSTGSFPFTTSTIFTTITIVNIVQDPTFTIGRKYASVISAITSLKRLQTFLLLPGKSHGEHDAGWSLTAKKVADTTSAAAVFEGAYMAWKTDARSSDAASTETVGQNDIQRGSEATHGASPAGPHDDGVVLRNLSLAFPLNKITVVVGKVGSGKTSLLCSLLGELSVVDGEMTLPLRHAATAYVSQNPWIQGERSIKENIVFYRHFDEVRYQRALEACGLSFDIQQLPKGDNTLSKHLSGGQKQRVALCRAVYADAPTYVLDDVLSAVDASTAASINHALFSRTSGLLQGKTVIMATNSVQQMQLGDQIVQMCQNGVARMLPVEAETVSKLADNIDTIRRRSAEESDDTGANGESSAAAEVRAAAAKERKVLEMEEEQEEVSKGAVKISLLKRCFRASGWWVAVAYPLILTVQSGLSNGQLFWLQGWAKSVTQETLRSSMGLHIGILALLVVLRAAVFGSSLVILVRLYLPRVAQKVHQDEITGLLRSGADSFLNLNPGRMINRFTQDIFSFDFEVSLQLIDVFFFVIGLGYSVVLMAIPAPYLLGVIVAMAAMYYGIYALYSPSSRQLRRLELATKSPLHAQFQDTADVEGLMTIRALHMKPFFLQATSTLLDTSQRPYLSLWTVRVWLKTWLDTLAMILNTALVLLAVLLRHKSNAGLIAVALVQAISISNRLNGLMESWTELEIGIVALERIEQVIKIPADDKDDKSKLKEMPSCAPGGSAGSGSETRDVRANKVEFQDVTVGYGGKDGAMSLHNVSFCLEAGQRLGVCGRSGSGKSTTLLSLLRILEPASGRILIDGVDTSTLTGASVRRNISYIPQEPMMLPGLSVRENLDPEREHSDDEVYWSVLRQTGMAATISELDEGLDHVIDLQSLSMGQKQLLNVARALLKRRGLLVMDEATSNLDMETDAQIQLALATLSSSELRHDNAELTRAQSKRPLKHSNGDVDDATTVVGRPTTITIAHRLSTIMDYDKILVLGDGQVLEFGSPSELLALEDGEFKSMVDEQNRNVC